MKSFAIKLLLSFAFSGATVGYSTLPLWADTEEADTETATIKIESSPLADKNQLPDSAGVRLAKQELPELVVVLERLKQRAPTQFDKAVKDLDRAAKRLDSMKRREPELYESALTEWRMRAQLDLLKAKHKAKPSKDSEAAVESQQKAIKSMRTEQIEKELASIAAREVLLTERLQQAKQALERGEQRRQQLQAELAKSPAKPNRPKSDEASKKSLSKSENESRE